jgi:hypothetical protein
MPLMRDPDNPPDTASVPKEASLPPKLKLGKFMWDDSVWIVVLALALLAAKWGVIKGEDFKEMLIGVGFVLATKTIGRGVSVDALPFMRR